MKQKTCIFLSAVSLILWVLALITVLVMSFLQKTVKQEFGLTEADSLAIRSVPWPAILQAAVYLILTLIILLVLKKNPGRGGTIALTVISVLVFCLLSVAVFPAVSMKLTASIAQKGVAEMTSYSALTSAVNLILPILSTPARMLAVLALGGACGKDFREPMQSAA